MLLVLDILRFYKLNSSQSTEIRYTLLLLCIKNIAKKHHQSNADSKYMCVKIIMFSLGSSSGYFFLRLSRGGMQALIQSMQ